MVAWTTKRSDQGSPHPQARIFLGTWTPSCASGPCDTTLAPAGADGSFRDPEAPLAEGSEPTTTPIALTWDGTSYANTSEPRVVSCTTASGSLIPDGYTSTSEMSVRFVAGEGDAKPRVEGTIVSSAVGSAASRAKGCTDFVATEEFVGSPTGSVDSALLPEGEVSASLTSTGTPVASRGTVLWLGTMTLTAGSPARITGLTKASGDLVEASGGWGAKAAGPSACSGTGGAVVDKGADGVEEFTGLKAVALTSSGEPILAGTWTLGLTPNATGTAAKCAATSYAGRVVLVPST